MKGSTRAATALAVGYMLGRRRKFRTAAVMAAASAVGGTTVSGVLMKRGMKMLGSTDALTKIAPQLGEITDTVRGDLITAGKAAITNAAAGRVDALTDSIHERAERVRNPGAVVAEGAERAQDTARGAGRAASSAGGPAASAGGRAASAAGGTARRVPRQASADDEYDEDYEQEEPAYTDEADDTEGDDWDDTDDTEGDDRDDAAGGARDEYPADDADTSDERDAGRGGRAGSGPRPTPGRSAPRRSPVTRTRR
jgi:hypothetical protein